MPDHLRPRRSRHVRHVKYLAVPPGPQPFAAELRMDASRVRC